MRTISLALVHLFTLVGLGYGVGGPAKAMSWTDAVSGIPRASLAKNPRDYFEVFSRPIRVMRIAATDEEPLREGVSRQLSVLPSVSSHIPPCRTAAARQFCAWLEAFNSGKPEELRAFFEKSFPERLASIDQEIALQRVTGGFNFEKAEIVRRELFTALIQERKSGLHVRCTFEVEDHAPYNVSRMDLKAVAPALEENGVH